MSVAAGRARPQAAGGPDEGPGYLVLNPATGQTLERVATDSDERIEEAVAGAQTAFHPWRDTGVDHRADVLARVAVLFTERARQLAAIITEEMGKPRSQALAEVRLCAQIFTYYAGHGPALAAAKPLKDGPDGRAVIETLPMGPLLGVMPWNYPYYQVARFAAPNLMLGNTLVVKHAERCPRSAQAIEALLVDAGLPVGAYANVFASHRQVAALIADPRIHGVSLTGSERAGAIVGALAGRHLKKAVLKLGGSDPYIVLDADDVPEAARRARSPRWRPGRPPSNWPSRSATPWTGAPRSMWADDWWMARAATCSRPC